MAVEDDLKNAAIRMIKQSDLLKCDFAIFMPQHYREDGSCRCDDPEHLAMIHWGYRWDAKLLRWKAEEA